ncbi:unnamed protein product [Acanthoscelides obtectus]|nr:unnamed protein product [Acanthoscelides obtectus]CAH2005370.1 unnamed protein product [Acanthoscelides obtectus]CAK1625819.1 Ubiquitin-like-conjugating enzyme ATG10 [Acanthoscelides obtectus]CAK1682798.1 Ubiquitin-like-conjugating enzyme ATG10 [Acanthoscelides obtectus]
MSLSIEDFNRCIEDIVNTSDNLIDGWRFEQNEELENGKYIIKKEQKVLSQDQEDDINHVLTFEYHIAFNISYGVPVLCFNVWKQDGTMLTVEEFWKLNERFKESNMYDTITQMDHPVLRRPFFTLHPCRTHEIMEPFLEESKNPVVSWLTVVGPFVHLDLNEEYVKMCS